LADIIFRRIDDPLDLECVPVINAAHASNDMA